MKKRFDCVAMKRKSQEEIVKHLNGKSVEEQFAYWQTRNAAFRKWQNILEQPKTQTRKAAATR